MQSFNPLFNSFNMSRNILPFPTTGSSIATNAFRNRLISRGIGNKITLSGILNGAQKTIGTVNQIVPLYNQVKPMIENSKTVFNVFKGLKIKEPLTRNKRNTAPQSKQINPATHQQKENKINTPQNEPAKPFFL